MKKSCVGLLIVLFGLTLAVPDIFSDENKRGFSGFGFKAGMNLSKLHGGDYDSQLKAGMTLGGFLNYEISDRFSLQGELLFTQRGERTSGSLEDGTAYKTWIRINYLELPILAKFSFGSARLAYYALAGPYFAFKVGGKFGSEIQGQTYEDKVGSYIKGFDMGLTAGGGVGIPLSPSQLQFELKGGVGLLSIKDNPMYSLTHFFLIFTICFFLSFHRGGRGGI